MIGFRLERLVCEVPRLGVAEGYFWYELDGDADPLPEFDRVATSYNTIVATKRPAESALALLRNLPESGITHFLFEADDRRHSEKVVACAAAKRLRVIATIHLPVAPESTDHLLAIAARLAEVAPESVKVAYPAYDDRTVSLGIDALRSWPGDLPPLSVTPMGTRQGRVAAALAGSHLVFAPLVESGDRPAASWFRHLCESDAGSYGRDE